MPAPEAPNPTPETPSPSPEAATPAQETPAAAPEAPTPTSVNQPPRIWSEDQRAFLGDFVREVRTYITANERRRMEMVAALQAAVEEIRENHMDFIHLWIEFREETERNRRRAQVNRRGRSASLPPSSLYQPSDDEFGYRTHSPYSHPPGTSQSQSHTRTRSRNSSTPARNRVEAFIEDFHGLSNRKKARRVMQLTQSESGDLISEIAAGALDSDIESNNSDDSQQSQVECEPAFVDRDQVADVIQNLVDKHPVPGSLMILGVHLPRSRRERMAIIREAHDFAHHINSDRRLPTSPLASDPWNTALSSDLGSLGGTDYTTPDYSIPSTSRRTQKNTRQDAHGSSTPRDAAEAFLQDFHDLSERQRRRRFHQLSLQEQADVGREIIREQERFGSVFGSNIGDTVSTLGSNTEVNDADLVFLGTSHGNQNLQDRLIEHINSLAIDIEDGALSIDDLRHISGFNLPAHGPARDNYIHQQRDLGPWNRRRWSSSRQDVTGAVIRLLDVIDPLADGVMGTVEERRALRRAMKNHGIHSWDGQEALAQEYIDRCQGAQYPPWRKHNHPYYSQPGDHRIRHFFRLVDALDRLCARPTLPSCNPGRFGPGSAPYPGLGGGAPWYNYYW